ncbi:MAG: sigma-70 family RNA polymerase sigma factor [Deltaproteobacteria bacterium]|nr:sigma-70 family RNA polymerase sigma factor [Deltaproteobacteria bacterium]MBN2672492.1 sigma-70 family RNA polymerase sigma factor [Deltaproteobacteria bacterium]
MTQEKNKDLLAQQAMPKLESIVMSTVRRLGRSVDVDEIRSHAMAGLAEAIERFDPAQNTPIEYFAAKRIRGAISDGLNANKFLPRRLIRQVAFLRASEEMMRYETEHPPPRDKVETVHRLANRLKDMACAYVTTCTAMAEEQSDTNEAANAEYAVERKQYYTIIKIELKKLPEPQRSVLHRFFFQSEHLKDIAADYGKSKSWASRQLHTGLQSMRNQFPATDIQTE